MNTKINNNTAKANNIDVNVNGNSDTIKGGSNSIIVNVDDATPALERRYYLDRSTAGEATVVAVVREDQTFLRLDSTLFHPRGGGQRADIGTVDGIPVLDVVKGEDEAVLHRVSDGSRFETGQRVRIIIDRQSRECNSAFHTAGHLIAGLVEQIAPQLTATQGHHWPGEARVEFSDTFEDTHGLERTLAAHLRDAIESDAPVVLAFEPPHSRLVTISGFAPVPCGGTHVSSLAQLGEVHLRNIKVKGGRLRVGYEVVVPTEVVRG
jgi:Ser-tRNA(Ala) deacylase AlaX